MIEKSKFHNSIKIGCLALMIIGVFFRLFRLGAVPVGLNADEASIGYEAFSLLKTGADRWGIKLPPYFLSFGSGQNTLYAYLSIPFLYFFDLSQTSIRLLSAILGLGTIPIVYLLAKLLFKNIYLVWACTILYLFDPYLFITSRWALEPNILPFFLLLSLYLFTNIFTTIGKNIQLDFTKKLILVASIPSLAFIIYSYASALFVIAPFLIIIFIFYWNEILRHKKLFLFSFFLFLLLLGPFFLFILKNNILKTNLSIESYLPFEIPKMLSNREEIFKSLSKTLAIVKKNFIFIFSGFKEFDRSFNTTKFYTSHFFLLFSLVGLAYLAKQMAYKLNKQFGIIFFWCVCSFIPFLLFEMNLNRSVHLQAILPLLSMLGLFFLFENISDIAYKKNLVLGFVGLFLIQALLFFGEYFNRFPGYDQFVLNFDPAIKAAVKQKKTNEKIAITSNLVFNYLFVNFYTKYSPTQFHNTLKADFSHPNVAVHSFGDYCILGDISNTGYFLNGDVFADLKKEKSFLALLTANEKLNDYKSDDKSLIDTSLYTGSLLYHSAQWKVMRFNKKTE